MKIAKLFRDMLEFKALDNGFLSCTDTHPRQKTRHCEEQSDWTKGSCAYGAEAILMGVPLREGLPGPSFVGTRNDRRCEG